MRFMRHESWDDALFVHYPVDAAALQRRLPPDLVVDTHDGVAYVGAVLLTESGIVPFPPRTPLWLVRWLSVSHHAVNVRTYVRPESGGPAGIYFFTLDCSALLPTIGAFALFNLPYRYSRMEREQKGARFTLRSKRVASTVAIAAEWEAEDELLATDRSADAALGRFFVERYVLYQPPGPLLRLFLPSGSRLWAGAITHAPWPLRRATLVAYGGMCSAARRALGGRPLRARPGRVRRAHVERRRADRVCVARRGLVFTSVIYAPSRRAPRPARTRFARAAAGSGGAPAAQVRRRPRRGRRRRLRPAPRPSA